MRTAVIDRGGVLHYALKAAYGRIWYVFCDTAHFKYRDDDIETGRVTCVRCLGEEALRGEDLMPIDLD